jgi:hypothetical protein
VEKEKPVKNLEFLFRIVPNYISEFFIGLVTEMCKLRIREGIQREDFIQELIDINKESEANGEGTGIPRFQIINKNYLKYSWK